MLRDRFLDRFDDLLAAWRRHDEIKRRGAIVSELAGSRMFLDDLRREVNDIRRSFAPEPAELESVLLTTYCPSYQETVFLYTTDADWVVGEPRFACACGQLIDGATHLA